MPPNLVCIIKGDMAMIVYIFKKSPLRTLPPNITPILKNKTKTIMCTSCSLIMLKPHKFHTKQNKIQ